MQPTDIIVHGVRLSASAVEVAEGVGGASKIVAADLAALREGKHTAESLLAYCLDGADEAEAEGWREYVEAVVAAVRS